MTSLAELEVGPFIWNLVILYYHSLYKENQSLKSDRWYTF